MWVALREFVVIIFLWYSNFSFAKMPSVEDCKKTKNGTIDCRNLGFRNVPYDIFANGIAKIHLSENPYHCDCSFVWFLREPKSSLTRVVDFDKMKCADSEMKDQLVKELTKSSICKTKQYTLKPNCFAFMKKFWMCTIPHKRIPADVFSYGPRKPLPMQGDYPCDCDSVWFIRRFKLPEGKRRFKNATKIRCKPNKVAGILKPVPMYEVSESQVCPQKDVDVCLAKTPCDANANCFNTGKDEYECRCKLGYTKLDGVKNKCTDLNECSGNFTCSKHAFCLNTHGSYKCKCKPGFSGDGKFCEDIDECKSANTECSVNAACRNLPGSFQCVCKKGYHGDGQVCSDVNECVQNKYKCPAHSKCHNVRGSYTCKCLKGFKRKKGRCVDVNECKLNSHDCHKNAMCFNHAGSYECRCKEGFEHLKNGRLCLKKEQESDDDKKILLIIAAASGALLLIIVIFCCVCCKRRSTQRKRQSIIEESSKILAK